MSLKNYLFIGHWRVQQLLISEEQQRQSLGNLACCTADKLLIACLEEEAEIAVTQERRRLCMEAGLDPDEESEDETGDGEVPQQQASQPLLQMVTPGVHPQRRTTTSASSLRSGSKSSDALSSSSSSSISHYAAAIPEDTEPIEKEDAIERAFVSRFSAAGAAGVFGANFATRMILPLSSASKPPRAGSACPLPAVAAAAGATSSSSLPQPRKLHSAPKPRSGRPSSASSKLVDTYMTAHEMEMVRRADSLERLCGFQAILATAETSARTEIEVLCFRLADCIMCRFDAKQVARMTGVGHSAADEVCALEDIGRRGVTQLESRLFEKLRIVKLKDRGELEKVLYLLSRGVRYEPALVTHTMFDPGRDPISRGCHGYLVSYDLWHRRAEIHLAALAAAILQAPLDEAATRQRIEASFTKVVSVEHHLRRVRDREVQRRECLEAIEAADRVDLHMAEDAGSAAVVDRLYFNVSKFRVAKVIRDLHFVQLTEAAERERIMAQVEPGQWETRVKGHDTVVVAVIAAAEAQARKVRPASAPVGK